MAIIKRYSKNPVIWPNKYQSWEAESAFNGSPVKKDDDIILAYRATSKLHFHAQEQVYLPVSQIGVANSHDGKEFHNRKVLVRPDQEFDKFGCEDPRVTYFEGKYYIFYTALSQYPFNPQGIKVAVAISDDMNTISEKHLVTPFNAKAMTLFPERINGKIAVLVSVNTDLPPAKIAFALFDKIEDIWSQKYWDKWYSKLDSYTLPLQRNNLDQVEVGAQPIKTDKGWIIFHSYIRNYLTDKKVFGIEAALLDLNNLNIIKGRTDYPLLTPEEDYEIYGDVPNIVFPSGALDKGEKIMLYYGAADTSCCIAFVKKEPLLKILTTPKSHRPQLIRRPENPILTPKPQNSWEARAVFNPSVLEIDGIVHMAYRAMSMDNTSVMGYARSSDGINFDYRSDNPMYGPRMPFEEKRVPNGNSGCEDPRLTLIDEKVYMLYTAYNGVESPRVALTHISKEDFLAEKWENWTIPVLISPPHYDNKDACILPSKINGKYMLFHRMGIDVDYAFVDSLDFDGNTWLEENIWLYNRMGLWDDWKVGLSGTPIITDYGWLLMYHGVSNEDHIYRVGIVLMDKDDPTKILGRSYYPLLEPQEQYELIGQVNNVVFPEGMIIRDNIVYVYYGGADSVIGVATIDLDELIHSLELS